MDDALRSCLPMFSVSKNSKAYISGIQEGDIVSSINGKSSSGLQNEEATKLLRSANDRLVVELKRRNETCQPTSEESNFLNYLNHTNSSPEFGSSDSFSSRSSSLTGGAGQCPSDGELSTSTSDSQGSIIQVIDGRKHVLKTPSPCPSPVQADYPRTNSAPFIWSPLGTTRMRSGRSYKQVTFNIPTTSSSATEEIGEERGRRRGRKEIGEGGGGVGEMRDHTRLSSLHYSSPSSSPGTNEPQSPANAQPIRPTDAFPPSRNSTSGSGQGLTLAPNGNQGGISSSAKTSCQTGCEATTTTWSYPSGLPSGPVQRGGSRDLSQDRDLGMDFRSSFESRVPVEGASGVSEFRPNRSWSPAATQKSDRYGITGTQNVVKSSSCSYTPYEAKRGRGTSDDLSKLMIEVDTEAKLLGSAAVDLKDSGMSIGRRELSLPPNSSSLPGPRSSLSTCSDRAASPAWGKEVKSFESSRQEESGGNRGGDIPPNPINIIPDFRRTSLPVGDSSSRSPSPLVIKSPSVAPNMEQSKSVAYAHPEPEQNRARYGSLSQGFVIEDAKRGSLPLPDTGCKSPGPLIIKSSSVAPKPRPANVENNWRSNCYSDLNTESQRSTDLIENTPPHLQSLRPSDFSLNNKPLTVLLNNSSKAATCNPDLPAYKTVSSLNFESPSSRIEPTGYKSVSSINFQPSKFSTEPRRYRSLSPMPVETVRARSDFNKEEATDCVLPSTTIPSIAEPSHSRSVQPSNAYETVTNNSSEPLTHGSDSISGGISSQVYGTFETRRNLPSLPSKDSSQGSSRGKYKDSSSTVFENGSNAVTTELHKDFACIEPFANRSENLIDFETCDSSSTQTSSSCKQPIRISDSGLNKSNGHRSASSLGFDMLQCLTTASETRKSPNVFDSQSIETITRGEPSASSWSNGITVAKSQTQFNAWSDKNASKTEPPASSWTNGASEMKSSDFESRNNFDTCFTQNTSHSEPPASSWANGPTGLTKLVSKSSNQFNSTCSTESVTKQAYPISGFVNQVEQAKVSAPAGHKNSLQIVSSDAESGMDPIAKPMESVQLANTWLPSNCSSLESTSHIPADTLQGNKSPSPYVLSSNKQATALPNQSVICLNQPRTEPIPDYSPNSHNEETTTPYSSTEVETCQPECRQNPSANHVLSDCWSRSSASGPKFPCNKTDGYGTVSATISKSTVISESLGSKSTSQIAFTDESKADKPRTPVTWKSTITKKSADDRAASVVPFAQDSVTGKDPNKVTVERLNQQSPYTISASSADHMRPESTPTVCEGPVTINRERPNPLKSPAAENSTSSCKNSPESHVNGVSRPNWEPSCRPFSPYTLASFPKTSGYRPIKFMPSTNGTSTNAKSYRSASLSSDIPCRDLETSTRHSSQADTSVAPLTISTNPDSCYPTRPLAAVDSRFSSVPPDSYRVFNAPDPSLPVIEVTPPRPQTPLGLSSSDEANIPRVKSSEISLLTSQQKTRKDRGIRVSSAGTNSASEVKLNAGANEVTANDIVKDSIRPTSAKSQKTNQCRRERHPLKVDIDEVSSARLTCVNGNGKAVGSFDRQSVKPLTQNRDEDREEFPLKTRVSFGAMIPVENTSSVPCSRPKTIVGEAWNVGTDFFQKKPEVPPPQMWSRDNISMQMGNAAGESKTDTEASSPYTPNKNNSEKSWIYDEPSQNNNFDNQFDDLDLHVSDPRETLPGKQAPYADERIETNAAAVNCNGNWSRSEQLSKERSEEYSRQRTESERRAREASRRPVLLREEKIPKPFIKYRGIGPKDEETGVPIALRNWVDGRRSQKEWYREMYSLLHKKNDEYTRPSSAGNRNEYREQQDSPSRHMESDTEADYGRIRQMERPVSPAQSDSAADYRRYRQCGAATYNGNGKEKTALEKFDWSNASTSSIDSCEGSMRNNSSGEENKRKDLTSGRTIDRNANPADFTEQKSSTMSYADEYWLRLATKGLESERSSSISSYDEEIDRAMRVNSLQRPEAKPLTRTGRGKARALYTFRTQAAKELSFKKGDVISLCKQIDKNWYEGQLIDGRKGLVPANYIEVLTSIKDAQTSAGQREGEAIAKYTFRGHTGLELSFRKGDVVTLIRRMDAGWYEGRLGRCQGILPVTYIDIIREPKTPLNTPSSSLATTPRTGSPCGSTSALSDRRPSLPSVPVSPVSASPQPTSPVPASPITQFDFDVIDPPTSDAFSDRSDSTLRNDRKSVMRNGNNQHPDSTSSSNGRSRGTESTHRPSERPGSAGAHLTGSKRRSGTGTGNTDYSSDLERSDDVITMYNTLTARMLEELQRTTVGGAALKTTSGPCPDDIRDLLNGLGRTAEDASVQYPAYRALYDYKMQNDDELELKEGDVIFVMEKCDDGWFVGTSKRTDEFGTFPGNYVEKIE